MNGWRRYLLSQAAGRLDKTRSGLHLIPQGADLHRQMSELLREVGAWAPPRVLLGLCWDVHCLERNVYHAMSAEVYRR
jgi:hypothetical protein